ncbi:molecular chaperone HtpG [Bradyrhizobium sp. SYSU BS000235]|uniref:molecular chaperone HtpG n=1 Tax=Bradyrhizobium sp. SYSU BS000235 TaxID=3411332 RepID=UPI003C7771B1
MTATENPASETQPQTHAFEADVAKLLHLMVHSVYSDKDIFLRELISNAADACEKLRYEAIANPALLGDDPQPRVTLSIDPEACRVTVEDNGIGMTAQEMVEALGTIARSGTKAFMERIAAKANGEDSQLIGQFGVGFYSVFMVADKVDVISRKAGEADAAVWSSDGKGTYTVTSIDAAEAPARGTRVVLHVMEDAKTYTEPHTLERLIKARSGHVPVPVTLIDKPDAEARQVTDGAALWTKPKSEVSKEDYTDFYRTVAGQFDEPALTIHYRAEGRHDYSVLLFVPETRPFDLFDADRHGRMRLYVRRVFITDDAEIVPRYLRFVRGLVDSSDLPLNVSRELIQESPILTAIKKGVTNRVMSELEKLASADQAAYEKIWDTFGITIKEGLYEDFENRERLLGLFRGYSTASTDKWRSLKDYEADLKPNQTAIYYIVGNDMERLKTSPQLEGFRARGIEVLLLPDHVDSFWVTSGIDYQGKPFKSVTQGAADLKLIPLLEGKSEPSADVDAKVASFLVFAKSVLGDDVSEVRASERLTDSAVCIVAPETGMDRQLEKLLASAGRPVPASKPVLEVNPSHELIRKVADLGDTEISFREDVAHLLLDEALVADGDRPRDPKAFSARLGRLIERGALAK